MRVLVTGHTGYIGSVLAPILRTKGHDVVGLDAGFFEDCTLNEDRERIRALRKDVREVTVQDLRGFDAVVHLAALSNDPLGDLRPELTLDINYRASVRLARLAKEARVPRFVFASSCSMYGAAGEDEILTEESPLRPVTPYAESKVRTESEVSQMADADFSPVFMRNATAYGVSPRLRADIVLNNLACWACATGKVRIQSDGRAWRPIVHIRDIANACAAILAAPRQAIHNQAFNIGADSENYQVRDLAEIVRQVVPRCDVEFAGQANHDPRNYRVNFGKLARTLPDFKPEWNAVRGAHELYAALEPAGVTQEAFQGRRFTRLEQLKFLMGIGRLNNDLQWNGARKTPRSFGVQAMPA
jgi:nucleoside-diphosphate-sugar epimerase